METTRVPGQPAHNAAAIARQKPGQPPAGDDSAAAGGFLALLAAMGGDEGAITVAGNEGLLSHSDGTTPQDSVPTSAEIAQGLLQAGCWRSRDCLHSPRVCRARCRWWGKPGAVLCRQR